MRQLVPIAPQQLGAVWPRLREQVASEFSPSDGWLPEDVYMAIKLGGANLYLIQIDGVEAGFLVLRTIQDFDGPHLHIWLLYARSDVDVMAEFSDEIDLIAKGINASIVTFGTTRRGWAKVAPRYQFTQREVIYQREVKI